MSLRRRMVELLGDRNVGHLEYFLRPGQRNLWGGPFNGQKFRQHIFLTLLDAVNCQAIVETGTFRGTTTEFLAASGLPVLSVESDPRYHAYASWRLRRLRRRVRLYLGDSREFLRQLAHDPQFSEQRIFFYLDAHWHADLPLRDELQVIFNRWPDSTVMVDDFQVPGTTYGYDDYGRGNVLNLEYLEPLRHLDLAPFFPAVGPERETGQRRGSVVLCLAGGEIERLVRQVDALVPAEPLAMEATVTSSAS